MEKVGNLWVERKPGNWKETAGALKDQKEKVEEAIRILEDDLQQ